MQFIKRIFKFFGISYKSVEDCQLHQDLVCPNARSETCNYPDCSLLTNYLQIKQHSK